VDLPANVSAQIGVKGGTLKAKGMTLEIPEGALDKQVMISAKNRGMTAPAAAKAKQLSDLYEFEPAGTKFKKDVKITFRGEKADPNAVVYFTKEDASGFEKIPSESNDEEVSAYVKHFSQGFVGVPLDDLDAGLDPDASEVDAAVDPSEADVGPEPESDADVIPSDAADVDADVDAGVDAETEAGVIPTTHIVVHSRDRFGVLVNQTWAAFQDGQGAWQPLAPSSQTGVYEFDVASARFGVAFVCSSQDLVNSWGSLSYGPATKATLDVTTEGAPCTSTAPLTHSVQGTLTLGSHQYWRLGHAHQASGINFSTIPAAINTSNFLEDEVNDLLFASGPDAYTVGKILVRRDLALKADITAYNRDMVKEGVDAGTPAQAQVLNASDATSVDVRYVTRGTQDGLWLNASTTAGSIARTVSFATLPESVRRSTDRYLLLAADETQAQWRRASLATYPTGNLSVTLPAPFPSAFSAQATPYLRPSYSFTLVANASQYMLGFSYSPSRTSAHDFVIAVDPAWLDGSASQSLTFPDFSDVLGFQPAWVPPSSAAAGTVNVKAAVLQSTSDAAGTRQSESGQSTDIPAL
jgi:hypothetical protein